MACSGIGGRALLGAGEVGGGEMWSEQGEVGPAAHEVAAVGCWSTEKAAGRDREALGGFWVLEEGARYEQGWLGVGCCAGGSWVWLL